MSEDIDCRDRQPTRQERARLARPGSFAAHAQTADSEAQGDPTDPLAFIHRAVELTRMTWGDLRDAWRSRGVAGLVEEFRESVQFPLVRHGELRIIAHDLEQVAHPPPPDGVAVRALTSARELDAVTRIVNRRSGDRLRRAMAAGRICLAAWRAEQPLGYTCLSSQISLRIEQFPIPLPEDVIYGWNLYVVPEERRFGIGSALTGARLRHSRALGYKVGWRAIDVQNRGSVGTVRNTAGDGTRVVGHLRYVKVLGWTWSRLMLETPGSSE